MRTILSTLLLLVLVVACGQKDDQKTVSPDQEIQEVQIAQDLRSIEVSIEGMTCEIGCARTIQSKLSKVEGVSASIVDFESGKGFFTYDANQIDQKVIVDKITGIAGGEVYSVSSVSEIVPVDSDTE
jgi:Cu+-exporting ATPase